MSRIERRVSEVQKQSTVSFSCSELTSGVHLDQHLPLHAQIGRRDETMRLASTALSARRANGEQALERALEEVARLSNAIGNRRGHGGSTNAITIRSRSDFASERRFHEEHLGLSLVVAATLSVWAPSHHSMPRAQQKPHRPASPVRCDRYDHGATLVRAASNNEATSFSDTLPSNRSSR